MTGLIFKRYRQHQPAGEVEVPNGCWVLRASRKYDDLFGELWGYELIGGVSPEGQLLDSNSHGISGCWSYTQTLFVADEPFAALTWESSTGSPILGRRLVVACQVHKGQLGRNPPIRMPKFAMVGGLPQGNPGRRHKLHNKLGWARLAEVADLADKSIEQILDEYWPVIDYHWGDPQYVQPASPVIHVIKTEDASLITGEKQQIPMHTYTMGQVLQMLREGHDFSHWWIRKGVAKAILYVVHFGHTFDNLHA